METTKGLFSPVVDATVRALYETAKEEQSSELYYQELGLNEYEPDVPEEVLQDISGFESASLTGEGQEYAIVTRVKGYPVTLKMRKYTAKFEITEEDIHWMAKSGSSKRLTQLRDAISGFEASMNDRWNKDACKVFYLGFGTTFLTCGNSEALFASHTLKTGSTQRNTFASGDTHRALTADALVLAISLMNRFQAQNGQQLRKVKDLRLIVATENAGTAYNIIDSLYGPTMNLNLNLASAQALARRGMTIKVVEASDIPAAYSAYWFLVDANRAKNRAFIAYAWKPRMNQHNEYSKGSVIKTGSTLFGPVLLGWQWAFGSTGSGSAI